MLFKALTIETEGGDPVGAFAWRPLVIISSRSRVFGLMLPPLGMLIALPVLIVIASLAGDEFHWKRRARSTRVILTVASLGHLHHGLKLTIPLWPTFIR